MSVTEQQLTAEDARAFLDAVNHRRARAGLDPIRQITKTEYMQAEPSHTAKCLSATFCYGPVAVENGREVADVLTNEASVGHGFERIPDEILRVTDEFDALSGDEHERYGHPYRGSLTDPVWKALVDAGIGVES